MNGPQRFYYTYTTNQTTPVPAPGFHTSRVELQHILLAYVVLTVDLAIILNGDGVLSLAAASGSYSISWDVVVLAAVAALTGFLIHEMAHKYYAQRHGFWAEFRMSPFGLIFSLLTAFAGFLFAAPGATLVQGMTDLRSWGRTALAGPASNLLFAGAFLAGTFSVATLGSSSFWVGALALLTFFNAWFAAFNLIPFGPLDGAKVWRWSRPTWAGTMALSAGLAILAFGISNYGWWLPGR
ncbi:MAG: zinc metalloprotease [Thermoplasmata archaeon]|jgi:Zn-dependent protease